MLPQLSWLAPYFKLETFRQVLPSLVEEYNGQSTFDLAILESHTPSSVKVSAGEIQVNLYLTISLQIGGETIRKISINPLIWVTPAQTP